MTKIWRHFDFWLLGVVAVLTIFGITMISSTIAGNIDLAGHARRQATFAVMGFVALFVMAWLDYHVWSAVNRPVYIIMVSSLVILLVVAKALFGSTRWFQTTLVSIQPSEFAKIVIILVLAEFFMENKHRMGEINTLFRSGLMAAGIVIPILIQPNLSTSIVILVIWFAMLWVSGLEMKHLILFSSIGAILLMALVLLVKNVDIKQIKIPFLAEYQLKRISNFIEPEENASYGDTYNLEQALISIGSGGWMGQGYGQGPQVQLRFLKVRHSDFIFSALAHEFGFVGTVLVLLLLAFVIFRCLLAARQARDTFGALICYGVATLLAFQAIVNVGVNLRLLPATGLPLPFISYGGSSLFSLLICIGLVESVILRHKSLEF